MKKKKSFALIGLAISMALGLAVSPVKGRAEAEPLSSQSLEITAKTLEASEEEGESALSQDELFAGYVEKLFYGDRGISLYSSSFLGEKLTGQDKIVYDALKPMVAEVASGMRDSAVFQIPLTSIIGEKLSFTAEELGIDSIIVNNQISQDAKDAMNAKLTYNLQKVMKALLNDCPYELYWYNKTGGYSYTSGFDMGTYNDSIYFPEGSALQVAFKVSTEYRGSGDDYSVDTVKTGAATSAVAYAKAIVDEAAVLSDYQKMDYYREKICELTSYNDAAASNPSGTIATVGISPWQLIYVFDNDPETKVVCEGYSKAFQYLMEMTQFNSSEIYSILVTGTMGAAGGSAGGHMWNLVHMEDNKTYLVDITNCDTGMAGEGTGLFLRGYQNQLVDPEDNTRVVGYQIHIPSRDLGNGSYTVEQTINYVYYTDTLDTYTTRELEVSASDYQVPVTSDKVTFEAVSIELGGEIGVNFFVNLPEEAKVEGACMEFTVHGESMKADYTGAKHPTNEKGLYKFTCYVNSIQMADEIVAVYHYGEKKSDQVIYSVEKYLDALQNNPGSTTQVKAIAQALRDYGYYAQQMFSVKNGWTIGTEHVGMNTERITTINADPMPDFSSYALSATGTLPADVKYEGYALDLASRTSIYLYFTVTGAAPIFRLDGEVITATKEGESSYLVVIPDITAGKLDHKYTLSVGEGCTMELSAFSYAYSVSKLEDASKDALKKVMIALKNYSDAVNASIG